MSTLEDRVKIAFDAIVMPSDLKEDTLKALALRRQRPGSELDQNQDQAQTQEQTQAQGEKSQAPGFATRLTRKPGALKRGVLALAACFLFAALGFGGYGAYATETAIVGIELNPSIELGVNRFGIVVDARANNDDGESLLSDVSIVGRSYEEALSYLTASATFLSYIVDTSSFVEISVVCDNEQQSSALISESEAGIEVLPCEGICNRVSAEKHEAAAEAGMGIGRYEAAQVLMALDPGITLEECQNMSMKEMRQLISEHDPENEYVAHRGGNRGRHGQHASSAYNQSGFGAGGSNPQEGTPN